MLRLRRTIAVAASTEGQDKLKTSRIIWRKDGSSRKEDEEGEAPNTPRSMQRFSEHAKEIAKLKMEFFFRSFRLAESFLPHAVGKRIVDRIWKADLRPHWGVASPGTGAYVCSACPAR